MRFAPNHFLFLHPIMEFSFSMPDIASYEIKSKAGNQKSTASAIYFLPKTIPTALQAEVSSRRLPPCTSFSGRRFETEIVKRRCQTVSIGISHGKHIRSANMIQTIFLHRCPSFFPKIFWTPKAVPATIPVRRFHFKNNAICKSTPSISACQ